MTNHTNSQCAACANAHNGINGRYCRKLGRYVEHSGAPRCSEKNGNNNGKRNIET